MSFSSISPLYFKNILSRPIVILNKFIVYVINNLNSKYERLTCPNKFWVTGSSFSTNKYHKNYLIFTFWITNALFEQRKSTV